MKAKRAGQIAWRLTLHEFKAFRSLGLWIVRRKDGVGPGDHAIAYTAPQTAMLFGFLFVAVVETVALAFLIPWPLVHALVLFLDVYTVVQLLGLHAACVTRPHVVGADGSLRIRYGALFDLRIRPEDVVNARVDRRYPEGSHFQLTDEVLDIIVGSQTNVRIDLTTPIPFVRPLGMRGHARVVRFHADDAPALVAALKQAGTVKAPDQHIH
ncbi:hypothetical protein [Streptomyces sp. NBC_01465]|uniref:hypothetical protein n=1 Tax=Streptomyces sp. NBC_01465 TaxID=2903878 RepID=UPI002E36913B|nr:hypothetical protein [Streptomyces sp. NBC_01465]